MNLFSSFAKLHKHEKFRSLLSMKGFISRLHKIQLEDYLMTQLSKSSGGILSSKLVSREKQKKVPKANI
jgi:hypothetical protein